MAPILDVLRLFVGVSVLSFAAYTDWRWRRAPNVLWAITLAAGCALLLAEAMLDPAGWIAKWPYLLALPIVLLVLSEATWTDALAGALGLGGAALAYALRGGLTEAWPYLAMMPAFAALVYGLWWLGLIAGGADAKALLALAVLLPLPLAIDGLPLVASVLPGAAVVLVDSLLAFMLVPLGFLAWNLAHGDARLPHAFLGVRRRAADVRRGFAWPMETVDAEGRRRTRFFASRMSQADVEETFERVQALGDERVWVSPKIPFMIPMLAGLLLAFTVGDLLAAAMGALASR